MKPLSAFSLLLLFVTCSEDILAACDETDDRLRGRFQFDIPANAAELLHVQQPQEEVNVQIVDEESQSLVNHPGGAGLDHFVVLDSKSFSRTVDVCLMARYHHSEPGTFIVDTIALDSFSPAEISILRDFTRAAESWAEDTPDSRADALEIYSEIAVRSPPTEVRLQAEAILFEAMAHMRRSEHARALERLDVLTAIATDDPVLLYKSAWKKGEANLRLNKHELAVNELQKALAIVTNQLLGEQGDAHRDLTDIRILLAETFLAQGNPDMARPLIDLATMTAGTEYRLLARVYDVLGYLHIVNSERTGLTLEERRGFLGESINVMLTGRFLSESAADPVTLAAFENNLGFAYDRLGETQRALTHFRQILDVVDPAEDPLVYRFAFANLGRLYQYIADYPRSESYYRQAVSLGEMASGGISTTRCPLGTTLRLSGDAEAALVEHELCLQQAEAIANHGTTVSARFEIGEDLLALGDEENALRHIQWAWEQSSNGVSVPTRARIVRRYAYLLQQRGRVEEANAAIQEAMTLQQSESDRLSPADIVENHAMVMQIAMLQERPTLAEEEGMLALQLIEAQYEELESERLGPAWSSRTHEIYVQLAEHFLKRYFQDGNDEALRSAFDIVERSRAISLRQQFAETATEAPRGSIDSIRRAAERAQIEVISRIANEHAIVRADDTSEITLPANYYHHQDLLSLHRLDGIRRLPLPPAMTIAEIQAGLSREQAVLYYLMGEQANYIFSVTAQTLAVTRLEDADRIDELMEDANLVLSNANASPYQTLAQLSEHLLSAMPATDGVSELLIVPHGALHSLSFAALPIPGSSRYQPLVSRYSLQTIPSLTTYLMDKSFNAPGSATDIAIFADPLFDAQQLGQQVALLESTPSDTLRGWSDTLQRLPNTAVEAANLQSMFTRERTILLTGNRASRANLAREDIRNAKVLHIATHGYFNAASDDNVGLGFSVVDENGVPDSGFVTLPELFSYRFNNELVVISGCDTAMGRPLAGEGMMGLSRGFIAQGAKHVISTLWPVSDRASADFMAIFYRQLLALGNVSHALQAAQNELQQNPDYRNPFYWAAYTLTSVSADQSMKFAVNENPSPSP